MKKEMTTLETAWLTTEEVKYCIKQEDGYDASMKLPRLSEVISTLEKLKEKYGDGYVKINNDYTEEFLSIDVQSYSPEYYNSKKVFMLSF